MSTSIIYGFLSDSGLAIKTALDLTGASDQGFGYLHGEAANYLVNRGVLNDTRSARLPIVENARLPGSMSIYFDSSRTDTATLNQMTSTEFNHVFNILERCYLAQQYTDTNLEDILTKNTDYTGYVENSLKHDTNETTIQVTNVNGYEKNVDLHDYICFQFKTENCDLEFHIWLKLAAFKSDYPYTTITKVISPYSPKLLIDSASLLQATNLDVLSTGSNYIFDQTDTEMASRDQNGVYIYKIKYVISSSVSRTLPFALAYCGAKAPSSLDCRSAIKNMITEAVSISDDALKEIFPELFIDSRFYIVPMWDVYSQLTDRDVYNSILSIAVMNRRSETIFTDYEKSFRESHLELLTNSQNKMFSICMPDALNTTHMSILEQHPTYVDYSSQTVGWKYMTEATQEFAGKLIRCMAVLNGETASDEFLSVEESNKQYLVFTSGESEYFVLTKDSYMKIIDAS